MELSVMFPSVGMSPWLGAAVTQVIMGCSAMPALHIGEYLTFVGLDLFISKITQQVMDGF